MVGSAITRNIDSVGKAEWIGASREELDLTDANQVRDFLRTHKPDAVINAAARVGGILANQNFPVSFLSENLMMQTNICSVAHEMGIQKLVFLGSSCIYPKMASQPIAPDSLLTGPLEETNEPYAIAKIAGVKLVQGYRQQFGHDWISLMPTNLYGPGDTYDEMGSHVIPGMIQKFCAAKKNKASSVELWGSGQPLREFLHVNDLADAVLFAANNYSSHVPLNVGSGEEISIRKLAELIQREIGFTGEIVWDANFPDGTPRKLLDSSALRELGWRPTIKLQDGIRKTIRELPFDC